MGELIGIQIKKSKKLFLQVTRNKLVNYLYNCTIESNKIQSNMPKMCFSWWVDEIILCRAKNFCVNSYSCEHWRSFSKWNALQHVILYVNLHALNARYQTSLLILSHNCIWFELSFFGLFFCWAFLRTKWNKLLQQKTPHKPPWKQHY